VKKGKRSKYAGAFFPVVNIVIDNNAKVVKRDGNLTIAELSKMMMPNANATASKAVGEMLALVQSQLPITLDGILDESNVSIGGLLEAKVKLQMLKAITEAGNEEANTAILLAMRVCRLVAHEVYRRTEEFIGKGVKQTQIGKDMASQNAKPKFEISKSQLLKDLSDAFGSNHKERCSNVGKKRGIGQRTILAQCSSLGITAKSYKKKS